MITKNVTVYLGDGYPVRIPVSQYDTMWRFVFKVVYNDEEWTIPEGAEVVLNGRKQDGNVFAYHGTVSNNRITVDCHVQITPVPGEVFCELSIMSGTKTVGTANFIIDVEQAPKTNDDVISESALDAYGEILDEIATVTGHMVPAGGSSGQVLAKLSGDDYDTGWVTGGGGGGDVSDVTVAGSSVVSGGVAAVPKADENVWGVVKHTRVQPTSTTPGYDIITSNGLASYTPIVDEHTHTVSPLVLPDATTTTKGAISAADKTKLDGLHGLPSGGTSGYVLKKASGTDYDVTWAAESGGGGGGISDVKVNGVSVVSGGVASIPTGGRADYGVVKVDNGLSSSSINPVQNLVVTAALAAKYEKPSAGIPASDIASGVIPSSASDVGAIAAPSSPATGSFLVYNGTAWVAQTLSTWQGGNY